MINKNSIYNTISQNLLSNRCR